MIDIFVAAGMEEVAKNITRRAVEAGNEVPDLPVRYGDERLEKEPEKALEYYRKAAFQGWVPARVLIKLGRAYAATHNLPVAESCWREAWNRASADEQAEIRECMKLPAGKD